MRTGGYVVAVLSVLAMACVCAHADKVADAIGSAGSAYAEGDYKETSTQLQTALVGVNEKLIGMLNEQFPAPPSGWTADEPESIDATAVGAGFFATLVVSRTYHTPDDTSIDVTVAANSPLLATLRMFISNPMLASMSGQSGMKKASACGYDAVENADQESGTFETHVLAGNATLISFEGERASDMAHIRTLSNSMDCKKIVAVVE
jgi:hypothetical protein